MNNLKERECVYCQVSGTFSARFFFYDSTVGRKSRSFDHYTRQAGRQFAYIQAKSVGTARHCRLV